MSNTIMAIVAGACYSAAYVCPKQWTPIPLVLSAIFVLLMRGI